MESPGGVFAPARRALSVGILLSITAIACEGMAVATVMPSAALQLGGLDGYGWAFSLFMLASLVGAISAGQTADLYDASVPARLGFLSFPGGLLVAGLAPAWPILLLGRGLQGFGAGSLSAVAYVAVARGYPVNLRPRLLALLSSAWVMPALLGPAVAGQVAEHASWRLVFIGILPAVALGAWMLLPSLRRLAEDSATGRSAGPTPGIGEGPAAERSGRARWWHVLKDAATSSRVRASVRLAAGAGLVLLAAGLEILPAALVVGTLGVLVAAQPLKALLPTGTFTGRVGLPAAIGVRGLLAFGFFSSEALIPLGLSTERGLPPSLVGLSLTAGALAWVAASWIQDRAEARSDGSISQRAVRVMAGLLLIAIGISAVAVVILSAGLPTELVVVAWGLGGLGMGLAYPASTLTALGLAPGGQEGTAAASLQVAETVGVAIGTGAVGALFALAVHLQRPTAEGLGWGFLLSVGAILAAFAPAVRLAPSFRRAARWRPKPSS